jgi:acyl carrier protein
MLKELAPATLISDADSNRLLTEVGYDSLDVAGLLIEVEQKYDIVIDADAADGLNSLDDFVTYIVANTQ